MIATMRHALAAVLVLAACGPSIEEPEDAYMAFDVRYPQGSTPDQVVLVWGLEVDDWCEAEAARLVADYGAIVVNECAPVDGLWRIPRADGLSAGTFRTEAECRAEAATCEYIEL